MGTMLKNGDNNNKIRIDNATMQVNAEFYCIAEIKELYFRNLSLVG